MGQRIEAEELGRRVIAYERTTTCTRLVVVEDDGPQQLVLPGLPPGSEPAEVIDANEAERLLDDANAREVTP
jgi:hypothetical protein